ncbi:MAG TPA: hypothetical protein PLA96_13270, partial [Candidatus Brocadia sapporoensis]|nr:hypothetical protein [Candidatus Brocadia sapporoensis]
MTKFEILFGTKTSSIQKTCVIVPFLPPGFLKILGIGALKKGKLFATANSGAFTVIKALACPTNITGQTELNKLNW